MSGAADDSGNGRHSAASGRPADDERLREAIEDRYDLPGPYPVVLIAATDEDFRTALEAAIESLQGDLPYEIRERESRQGNYRSYRVELHVVSASDALEKKSALAEIPGVLVAL